ncbi:MAG: nucleotide sugar dehydrogenase [Bryobacteraceae bacterium]|jgi:UDP-N-acetyl-D-mannosaminuronic acid dehydrogenase
MSYCYDVCVVGGAGHVGLPLSIVFASRGQRVLIYDVNPQSLATIGEGKMPFMESGAAPLLRQALKEGTLALSSDAAQTGKSAALIIVIGTPVDEYLNPSLKPIHHCIDQLLPHLTDDQLLILRSTVYPGVTEAIARNIASVGKHPRIAFCPERIVQGKAVEELLTLPQIVSGTTQEAEDAAAALFGLIAPEIVRLSPTEAELVKLLSNAYRYIQFATTNQFYLIARAAGVDYYRVLDGMKRNYPRMAEVPRAGFAAGPCLFKDTMQLAAFYKNQFSLGYAAMLVNESLPMFVAEELASKYRLEQMVVGLLGMAFKADNDDPRSSLSYKLKKLIALRAKKVLTTDPHVSTDSTLSPLNDVVEQSDIIVLCVPHSAYKGLKLPGKIVVDIWNFWEQEQCSAVFV